MPFSGAAFATQTNGLDHLIPICASFGIPLVVPDDHTLAIVERCYPPMSALAARRGGNEVLHDARILFHSTRIPRRVIARPANRGARVVCVPHGWSDKSWWLKWMALEDVFLAYGPATLEMMQVEGTARLMHRYVIAGDQRLAFYARHRAWFDAIAQTDLFDRLSQERRTALYAPTWSDIESSSSLDEALRPLLANLPADWNLAIKLHPLTTAAAVAHVAEAIRPFPGQVALLAEHPLVYPFLSRVDAYIGDRSSIGYAFLHFDAPIVLIRTASYVPSPHDVLARCAVEVEGAGLAQIWAVVARAVATRAERTAARVAARDHVYASTLGESALRDAVTEACTGELGPDPNPLPTEFYEQRRRLMTLHPDSVDAISLTAMLARREEGAP